MSTQPLSAPRWHDDCAGRLICIDWNRWLRSGEFVDPYLVWADVSRFQGMGGWCAGGEGTREHDGTWPLLVEIEPCVDVQSPSTDIADELKCAMASMQIPGIYLDGENLRGRFFTARVLPDAIPYLLVNPAIRRIQLGLPRINATDEDALPSGEPQAGDNDKARTVIGIIDDGCGFANAAFCDADGVTRVHHLWDQDPARTPAGSGLDSRGWTYVRELGYGAELGPVELQGASWEAHQRNDEVWAYESVDYGPMQLGLDRTASSLRSDGCGMPASAMRRSSHGTSVMFLAAGVSERLAPEGEGNAPAVSYATPLRGQRATEAPHSVERTFFNHTAAQTDFATQWPIVFVQLPTRTILDTSGGSLGVHVLDGLHYIARRAAAIPRVDVRLGRKPDAGGLAVANTDDESPTDDQNPLVVVISYGAVAGCHDGTSIIERAVANFVNEKQYRWVCLAAGNQHRTRTHARLALAGQQSGTLLWLVGPDNPLQSFLEIWFPDQDERGIAMDEIAPQSMVVDLQPPGGLASRRVHCGELWVCEQPVESEKEPPVLAGAIFSRRVAQGLRGTMLLLAVSATRNGEPGASLHGEWRITVTNQLDAPTHPDAGPRLVVHAWAERNDLLYGNQRPQQSTVVSTDRVPQLTEFMPEASHFFRETERWWGNRHLPDELLPSNTLGSLAGLRRQMRGSEQAPPPEYKFDSSRRGWPVTIGAYRLSDGEVSAYSSGGPSRHAEPRHGHDGRPDLHRDFAYSWPLSWPADGPVSSAPADVGTALRGLRTVGIRSGSVARLSGTSAAAPSIARAIANMAYTEVWWPDALGDAAARFGISNQASPLVTNPTQAARATPSPQKDDRYRRGRWHVR